MLFRSRSWDSSYGMEQYLNALWLMLSLSLLGGCVVFHTQLSESNKAKTLAFDLAILACSVALLFPAISITDDLQYEDNAAVECWRAAEKPVFVKAVVESGYEAPCPPQILDLGLPLHSYSFVGESEQFGASSLSLALTRITRAPPFQSL